MRGSTVASITDGARDMGVLPRLLPKEAPLGAYELKNDQFSARARPCLPGYRRTERVLAAKVTCWQREGVAAGAANGM